MVRNGEYLVVSFTEKDVEGDLSDITVGVRVQYHNDNVQRETVTLNTNFVLGERRIVKVDCNSFDKHNICKYDGLYLTVLE